jgi:hypothetical protein
MLEGSALVTNLQFSNTPKDYVDYQDFEVMSSDYLSGA